MRPTPSPIPSVNTLRNTILSKALNDPSLHPSVMNGWARDVSNFSGPAPMENISTAQIESFLVRTGGIPWGTSLSQRSPAVVKTSSDQAFYTSQGYPAPPLGSVIRGVNQNGTLGTGNYLETSPAAWYIDVLLRLGDTTEAQILADWLRSTLFQASFFGSPVVLSYSVYKPQSGSWIPDGNTILLRDLALNGWAFYRMYQATEDSVYRNAGRSMLNSVALAINKVQGRVTGDQIAPEASGLIYQAYVSLGTNTPGVGPNYTFTTNRFTIEGLLGFALLMEEAKQVEGENAPLYDPVGTEYTIGTLLNRVGQAIDRYPTMNWIMRDVVSSAPYVPFQFVFQQAYARYKEYLVGVNFDWTEESGTRFGPTWWAGDLELWGIIGMLALKRMGYVSSPVETYLWDWLRLDMYQPYIWHNRYDINGEALLHDLSASITLTALYGLALLQGYSPTPPPPPYRITSSENQYSITIPGARKLFLLDKNGNVIDSSNGDTLTFYYNPSLAPFSVIKQI
jgi:hypothetical protein